MPQVIGYRGRHNWGIVAGMRLGAMLVLLAACTPPHGPADRAVRSLAPASEAVVRAAPRAHAWEVWRRLHEGSTWQGWPRSDAVLDRPDRHARALQPFTNHGALVTETLPIAFAVVFDPTAAAHVRDHGLGSRAVQGSLASLPAFPRSAITLKVIWYLVKRESTTHMPIWDGEPPRDDGNPDTTWQRSIEVRADALDDFEHHAIASPDELRSTRAAMHDDSIALGDQLVLVAMHVSTKELPDWLWATFWWHDRPDAGRFADGRPALAGAASHYLMDVTLASDAPSFNPWLEARFPDGTRSNCVTCHQRAIRGATTYLPVTLSPLPATDAYFANGYQTDFVWTLALEAR